MNHSTRYYKDLLVRFIGDDITPVEIRQLYTFIKDNPEGYEAIMSGEDIRKLAMEQSALADASLAEDTHLKLRARILALPGAEPADGFPLPGRVHRVSRWYWVAASVVILAGAGLYFYTIWHGKLQPPPVVTAPVRDIPAPATNRATVTLADGRQVFLDSAGNGQLAQQGNIKLVKLANGQIAYQVTDGSSSPLSQGRGSRSLSGGGEAAYNTLTNPRGSKVIDMTLSDGSRVWLNAGSSITYPVTFIGDERKVSMTGEAYFEIVPLSLGRPARTDGSGGGARGEAKKPFIVQKGDMQVTVLGTHFNVNAYDDESDIKVTLLEGSVSVSLPSTPGEDPDPNREGVRPEVKLKPGQQAQLKNHGNHSITKIMVQTVDLEQVIAWKNGKFNFGKRSGIQSVMRQIARWYDVEVVYEGSIPRQQFGGEVPRNTRLSEVLEILKTSGVKFSIEGRKVLIKP